MTPPLIATLEAGGTKMVAALASGLDDIRVRARIPTTTPAETIAALLSFFKEAIPRQGDPASLAIGTFGPADIDPSSPTYGHITATPKPGWTDTDFLNPLKDALGVPAIFDTDVNAALFGEARWGAAQGLKDAAYFTIGTGIGGAVMIGGQLIHGMGHTEMGHMRVKRHPEDSFKGHCPFHGDCLEGLASGSAIGARWGTPAHELAPDHQAWEFEADYLAQACLNLLTIAPPARIILGGGVPHQEHLFPMVRQRLKDDLNGYLAHPSLQGDLSEFIVPPSLADDAGLLGCVALGQQLL
ncbi:ROK family protein [bacterium]|nr:ROK family protein [bacterium]